ncbi:MAG: hypothetical protein ACM3X6_12035 [Patescibacteria group bacterium]
MTTGAGKVRAGAASPGPARAGCKITAAWPPAAGNGAVTAIKLIFPVMRGARAGTAHARPFRAVGISSPADRPPAGGGTFGTVPPLILGTHKARVRAGIRTDQTIRITAAAGSSAAGAGASADVPPLTSGALEARAGPGIGSARAASEIALTGRTGAGDGAAPPACPFASGPRVTRAGMPHLLPARWRGKTPAARTAAGAVAFQATGPLRGARRRARRRAGGEPPDGAAPA